MAKLETESKLELDRIDFLLILERGILKKKIEQVNIYFDSQWRLANRSSTFRIRLSPKKKPQVTFKIPVSMSQNRRIAREYEFELEAPRNKRSIRIFARELFVSESLPEDISHAVHALGIDKLERVGWVRNSRYVIEFVGVGEVELDHLRLPNGQDYFEVEIEESDHNIHKRIVKFIRQLVPNSRPSALSKFERFRRAIAAQTDSATHESQRALFS